MQHGYVPQSPLLREYIHHISLTEFDAPHREYVTVIPDAMTELVIVRQGAYERLVQNQEITVNKSHVIGIKSKPGQVKSNPVLKTVSVRFKPGAIGFFTQVPACEFKDNILDPYLLFGHSFTTLENQILECEDETNIFSFIENFFIQRYVPGEKSEITKKRIGKAYQSPHQCQIQNLSQSGESYKSLEREFKHTIGLSPKNLLRILQFNYATYCLSNVQNGENLTEIAYKCGYFDQAHFIKTFKFFAGTTPGDYLHQYDDMAHRNQKVINTGFNDRIYNR